MTTLVIQEKREKKEDLKRLKEAEKDFQKMKEELRPFLRPRRIETQTSAGRWIETSSLELVEA